jgi:predicted short-subunit dehydrogenase-like oxidoreductase (DUF2520 family)
MASPEVASVWPHVAALEESLNRLAEGRTVPVVLRPDRDVVEDHRAFFAHLRSQMYLAGL